MVRAALVLLLLGPFSNPGSTVADAIPPRPACTPAIAAPVAIAVEPLAAAPVDRDTPVTTISARGLALIRAAEGFVAKPYWDRTQWSVGYGTRTDDPIATITEPHARALLQVQAASISTTILARSSVPLQQGQLDALTSLAYNIGAGALLGHGSRAPSTLWQKLMAADATGASAEFARWNKSGGATLPGLTRRRHDEAELFCSDRAVADYPAESVAAPSTLGDSTAVLGTNAR